MQATPADQSRAAAAPRARAFPILGSALALMRDPLGFIERLARRHGDVVQFRLPGQRVYLFTHPDAIEQILVGEKDKLIKDKMTRELSHLLGNGLLVSEGELWRKQRRLAQPGFHRERIAAYGDVMVAYAERAVAGWRDGEIRDLHQDMMRLTLDIVAKTLFDVEVAQVAHQIGQALETVLDRFMGVAALFPLGVPLPGNRRARRAIAALDEIVYGIIRERRQSGDSGSLLSMLIAATSDEDGTMDDTQLRDEALTLLLAGHETTALTLGYTFHLLGQHPAAAARLHREIDDVLGARPATAADLPRLGFADCVVREAMRLYPPAWSIGRETVAPCAIGGYAIPAGTQLWMAQWLTQRDPRWFHDPDAFVPERWEGGELQRTLPRYAYFPFGGGPRICIGNAFAMMEAVLVLVTIARRARLTPMTEGPPALVPSVTLRPKHGLPMRIARQP